MIGAVLLGIWDLSLIWLATMGGLLLLAIGLVLLALARWGADPGDDDDCARRDR